MVFERGGGCPIKLLIGLQHPIQVKKTPHHVNLFPHAWFDLFPANLSILKTSAESTSEKTSGEGTWKKKIEKGAQEDDYEWWLQLSLDLHFPLWFIMFLVDTSPKFSFIKCHKRFDHLNWCYLVCKKISNLGGLEVAVTKNPSLF